MNPFGWIETIFQIHAATQRLEKAMAGLQDSIDSVKAAVADEANDLAELTTDVKSVADTLTNLRAELANAGATPDQLATLDAQAQALRDAHTGFQQVHQGLQGAVGGTPGTPGRPGA